MHADELPRLLRTLTLAGGPDWYHSPEGLFRQLQKPQKSCLLLPQPCSGCGAYVGLGWGPVIPALLSTSRIEWTGPIINPVQPGQTVLGKPSQGARGAGPAHWLEEGMPWGLDANPGGDRFGPPALPSGIRSMCIRTGFYLMEKISWLCRWELGP